MVIIYIILFFVVVMLFTSLVNWAYFKVTDWVEKRYGNIWRLIAGTSVIVISLFLATLLFKMLL